MANSDVDTASFQLMELSAAQSVCSDLDYAFQLQLEEALNVSLATAQPNNSASAATVFNSKQPALDEGEDEMKLMLKMQELEFEKYQQELTDHQQAAAELRRLSQEIHRRNHDAQFARSIEDMAEEEWEDVGNDYEKPFEATQEERQFKLYFKGLVSCDSVGEEQWEVFSGAGIVIYDPDDKLVLQVAKPLGIGLSRAASEYMALTEGLKIASSLGIRNVTGFGDSVQVHKQVTGSWLVRQHKIWKCLRDVEDQLKKLDKVLMVLLTRCDNKVALTLAREAIDSQLNRRDQYNHEGEQSRKENCSICLEENDMGQMYDVMSCHHRYCVSCMAQHVEVKLRQGSLPDCPHEACNTRLTVDGCKKFLSSKWIEVLTKRLEEAAIPESDKVYCPYSDCSALMTKTAMHMLPQACSSSHPLMCKECLKCHRCFCMECRVPWHANMSCHDYQGRAPHLYGVDAKLHLLAKDNKWRRCTKCKHMIELAEGCNHMTCRCGFEFCYVCGAEWKNKKQTCKCDLWEEHNIIREPLTDDDDYNDSEEEYLTDDEDYEYDRLYEHVHRFRPF